tara:strand:+ start:991 stop:1653 length:663 start_codon:yes stop_codon:yes gene_type:complete
MANRDSLIETQLNVRSLRSNCDKCGEQLYIIDLIPIISFLYLKGTCRFCGKEIEVQNLTAEIIFGFVFLFLSLESFNTFDLTFNVLFFSFIFAIALYDFEYFLVPKIYLLFLLLISCAFVVMQGYLINVIFASVITSIIFAMKLILDYIKKEETFGLGDVFVIFCLGLFFQPFSFSLILFLSSILGLLIFALRFILLNKEKKIPFATIMAIGALGISPLG